MMFGSKVRYGITYKTSQKSFDIYRRKFQHDFKVPVRLDNFEGSMGLDLKALGAIVVTKIDKLYLINA